MNDADPQPRLRPLRIVISTVVLVALVAAGYVALNGMPAAADADAADQSAPPSPGDTGETGEDGGVQAPPSVPVPVLTAPAERRQMVMRITATGNAEAIRQLELQAPSDGDLMAVNVAEGQVVAAGEVVAALDDTQLRLDVQRARESLVRAVADFSENVAYLRDFGDDDAEELQAAAFGSLMDPENFRTLIDDPRFDALFQTITRDEVMAARDNLLTQRANFEEAELAMERTQVKAPFGGQVAELDVVVGQNVARSTKLLTLVDASPIRVRVEVLESEAGLVRVGRRAVVTFAAYPGESFDGRVEAISPLVDPEQKTLEVLVTLPNEGLRLKPGMFAQIRLDTQIFEDRLLVPADAVLLRDDRPMVFRVVNGRSDWVYIQKGLENDEWVEVLEGIEAGDEIIVSGHYSLAHDAAVRVIDPEDDAARP